MDSSCLSSIPGRLLSLQPQSLNSTGTVTSRLYTDHPFQNKQPAGMIQTSVQHSVQNAASFLDTGITAGSRQAPAKALGELGKHPEPSCSRCESRAAAVPPLPSQPPSPSYLREYRGGFAGW